MSNNQINKLPDELADLTQLLRLDISHNLFLTLPNVVFKMPKLRQLKANNNAIIGEFKINILHLKLFLISKSINFINFLDIENDQMITSDSLEVVDLRKNPLTPQCMDRLKNARVSFHIELSERVKEDWEDLTI